MAAKDSAVTHRLVHVGHYTGNRYVEDLNRGPNERYFACNKILRAKTVPDNTVVTCLMCLQKDNERDAKRKSRGY